MEKERAAKVASLPHAAPDPIEVEPLFLSLSLTKTSLRLFTLEAVNPWVIVNLLFANNRIVLKLLSFLFFILCLSVLRFRLHYNPRSSLRSLTPSHTTMSRRRQWTGKQIQRRYWDVLVFPYSWGNKTRPLLNEPFVQFFKSGRQIGALIELDSGKQNKKLSRLVQI